MPQLQKRAIDDLTADKILKDYRDGYYTAGEKNQLLKQKAERNLTQLVNDDGAFKAVLTQTIKHVQENWDELKEFANRPEAEKSLGGAYQETKAGIKAAWDMIQLVAAPFNAIGEVSGNVAEQQALSAGASPGLAWGIGLAVDIGSGFVPVAGATRGIAKGIQSAAKEGKLGAKAQAKVDPQAALKVVEDIVKQGLVKDGAKIATDPAAIENITRITSGASRPNVMNQEDFLRSLRGYRREMEGITATKSHATTLAEARKLGLGVDDLKELPVFSKLNEAEMAAYLKALDEPVDNLIELSKQVLAGKADGVELGRAMQEFQNYAPVFRSSEVTAGRTVEVLKESPPMKSITNLMNAWDPESMAKLDSKGMWDTLAEDILSLADEPGKLKINQLAAKEIPSNTPNYWGMFKEVFNNGLLARPVTWIRTFLGNTVASGTHTLERELAGWVSMDTAKGVRRGEGFAYFKGEQLALGEAFSSFGNAFRKGNPQAETRFDIPLNQIGGPLGRLLNVPGNIVKGMDNFFKATSRNGDIYALAIRKAHEQGYEFGTDAFNSYVARRRLFPTEDMKIHAQDHAVNQTFQQELGTFGMHAQKALQYGPAALYWPFFRSGVNLSKWGLQRVPAVQLFAKSLYDDILEGGEKADMAVSRLILSNMFGQFGYGLVMEGILSNGGPVDAGERRSFLAAKRPYSIMGQYPIQNTFEPGSTPFEMIADFAAVRNQLNDPTAEQTGMIIGVSIAKDVMNNTWWKSASDIVDVLTTIGSGEELGAKGSRLLASPIIAVAQGGPLGAAIEREMDPVRRETRTWVDEVRRGPIARVFGYAKEGIAQRDGYGDPLRVPQALGSAWLREKFAGMGGDVMAGMNNLGNPFIHYPDETDPIKIEGNRLHVNLPQFGWHIGGGKAREEFDIDEPLPGEMEPVELNEQEFDRRSELYRRILRSPETGLQKLMDSEQYKNAPWAAQRQHFSDHITTARKAANSLLLMENKGLTERLMRAQAAKHLPMAQPEYREQIQSQFETSLQSSLSSFDQLNQSQQQNLLRWGIITPEEVNP